MPKPLSGKVLKLEIRVTPYDQQPIAQIDESDLQHIDKLVLCEEGTPNGVPRLHYHGYVETKKSESWLRSFLRKLSHAPSNEQINGNSLYFTRQCHEHTYGYIIKSGNVTVRHNLSQETLDKWLEESNQYAKDKSSERKRKQRTRDDELAEVVQTVEEDLQRNEHYRTVDAVVMRLLAECSQRQIRFPTRSQMESMVLKLLYKYDELAVRLYYTRAFPRTVS